MASHPIADKKPILKRPVSAPPTKPVTTTKQAQTLESLALLKTSQRVQDILKVQI